MAVTVEAPSHLERMLAAHERHLVDTSVALGAPNALGDVDAVIEVGKVRQIVDLGPPDRLTRLVARAHWLEHRTILPDELVAIVTSRRRRDARGGGDFHRRVAVAAIDAEPGHVVLV